MVGSAGLPLGVIHPPLAAKSLAEICRLHPADSKILVVPSYLFGRQLLETLARHSGGWLNLRLTTPVSLALNSCAGVIAEKGLIFAREVLLEAIFADVYNQTKKAYFPHEAGLGIIAAVHRAIAELRMAGIQPADINRIGQRASEKVRDLSVFLSAYEQSLSKHKYLDEAEVYRFSLGTTASTQEIIIIPESLRISGIARQFLQRYVAGRSIVLSEDPVVGLEKPTHRWSACSSKPVNALSFLNSPSDTPLGHPVIEMYSAVGERNEAREVVRRILSEKIPFEQVEIVAIDYGTYSRMLDDLQAEIEGIKFTFAGGLPPQRSRAARALAAFAAWIRDDYPDSVLRNLYAGGDLKSPEGVGGRQAASILQQSMIGWGIARYPERLDAHCQSIEVEIAEEEDEERVIVLKEHLARARAISGAVKSLVALVPSDGSTLKKYIEAAVGFLKGYVAISSESDGQVMAQIIEGLELVSRHADRPAERKDVAYHLESAIRSVRVDISPPCPGCIHVTGLHGAGLSGRRVHFVLGLDEGRFPGGVIQDPVLLDDERSALSPDLPLSMERAQERAYQLAEYLARVRGRLILSFSAFDLSDNRRSFPSPVLLQAFRLSSGNPDADYKALKEALGPPVGFLDGDFAVSRDDWWLSQLTSGPLLLDAQKSVLKSYPKLACGRAAEESRRMPLSTPHDGKLAPDKAFDPRSEGTRAISPSSLEPYAKCPRKYFFRTVLRIRPSEELAYEPGRWLDPMNRGALLHEFYQQFLGHLAGKGLRRDPKKHRDLASRMLNEVIEEWKEAIPPPSTSVFEFEREALHRSLNVFLNEESGRRSPGLPAYFEVSFGLGESALISLPDSVEIRLPGGGKFKANGRIDRIDRLGAGDHWEVWDYKTGSNYGYRAKGYVAGGTQLQHILYMVAAEKILKKAGETSPKVVSSGYLFPTERGEGKCFPRPASRVAEGLKTIENLFDRMAAGMFVGTAKDCKFCDYVSICPADSEERWKELMQLGDGEVVAMEEIRGRE